MNPSTRKRGFTLVELLVVVAIIAILAAIAIPSFTGAINKSRQATDDANARTAISMASAQYLVDNEPDTVYYVFRMNGSEMEIGLTSLTHEPETALDGFNEYVDKEDARTARGSAGLMVAFTGGQPPVATWLPASIH